jgi:citrate lyase subunit beta / citryl-CoA lyase
MGKPVIRSLLFVPGDSEKLILKALASEADAVILDLEDAVAPESKARARGVTAEALAGAERNGKPVFARLNAFDTGLTRGISPRSCTAGPGAWCCPSATARPTSSGCRIISRRWRRARMFSPALPVS